MPCTFLDLGPVEFQGSLRLISRRCSTDIAMAGAGI